jgi:hypothetical protein
MVQRDEISASNGRGRDKQRRGISLRISFEGTRPEFARSGKAGVSAQGRRPGDMKMNVIRWAIVGAACVAAIAGAAMTQVEPTLDGSITGSGQSS